MSDEKAPETEVENQDVAIETSNSTEEKPKLTKEERLQKMREGAERYKAEQARLKELGLPTNQPKPRPVPVQEVVAGVQVQQPVQQSALQVVETNGFKEIVYPDAELAVNTQYRIDPTRDYIFETVYKSDVPRHVPLGTTCNILHDVRIRTIRYVPMAKSIFLDEQMINGVDMYPGYIPPIIDFYRNTYIVPGQDIRLMEYMLHHDLFVGNKNRLSPKDPLYKLVDVGREEKERAEMNSISASAVSLVEKYNIDMLMPLARVVFGITDTDPVAVKNRLRDIAVQTIPKKGENLPGCKIIMENLDNPKLARTYHIMKAIDKGVVVIDALGHRATWANRQIICEMNNTGSARTSSNELTNFSFKPEGQEFWNALKNLMVV